MSPFNDLQEVILPVQAAIFAKSGSVGIRRHGGLGFHMVNVNEKEHTVKALSNWPISSPNNTSKPLTC